MDRFEIQNFSAGKLTAGKLRELVEAGVARLPHIFESFDCIGWSMVVDLGDPSEFSSLLEGLEVLEKRDGNPKYWPTLAAARKFLKSCEYDGGVIVSFNKV